MHRDELLFQVVHQSSELWLKLASNDTRRPRGSSSEGDVAEARCGCCAGRAAACGYVTDQLDMLEQMSPWEYQEIRKVLGHGSGFDSPGGKELRAAMARLGEAFHARRARGGPLARRALRPRPRARARCTSSPRR